MFRVYSIKTCWVRNVWINKYRGMKNTVSCSKIWCIFMSILFLGLWDHVTKEQQKPQSCVYFESIVWLSVTFQFSSPNCWLVLLWPFTYLHMKTFEPNQALQCMIIEHAGSPVVSGLPCNHRLVPFLPQMGKKRSCTCRMQVAVALLVNILRVQLCSFKCWG